MKKPLNVLSIAIMSAVVGCIAPLSQAEASFNRMYDGIGIFITLIVGASLLGIILLVFLFSYLSPKLRAAAKRQKSKAQDT